CTSHLAIDSQRVSRVCRRSRAAGPVVVSLASGGDVQERAASRASGVDGTGDARPLPARVKRADRAGRVRGRGVLSSDCLSILFLLRRRSGRRPPEHLRRGAELGVGRAPVDVMRMFARARALSEWRNRRTPDADGTTRVRLLKVVATLMYGGTETQFMSLGRSLDPRRFDLEFACLRRRGGFVSELEERRIPLHEYHITTFRSVKALAHQTRFARHIAERRIDIVHA